MQPSPIDPSTADHDIRLFRHIKRPGWGVAAIVWERDGKRGYQFSDGNLRVFKQGYFNMFQSALPPGDGSAVAVRRLARLAQYEGVGEATRLPTVRDQIALFTRDFPDGFASESWRSKHRGEASGRRLKRHRDAAITEATCLSLTALDDAIERAGWADVQDAVVELLAHCDLVSSSHLARLRKLPPSRGLVVALRDWLYGGTTDELEVDHDRRFNVLVRALGDAGTWPLVTSLAALVHPTEHTCVRETTYATQGKMLLSKFSINKRPIGSDYRRSCHVARAVFSELEQAGLGPRDLLDVYDFIWLTLRPAARDDLLTVPLTAARPAPPVAEQVDTEQVDTEQQVEAA